QSSRILLDCSPWLTRGFVRLCLQCLGAHHALHSFPTRRSSDLTEEDLLEAAGRADLDPLTARELRVVGLGAPVPALAGCLARARSEEHTSELQSRENVVCRLLLEKKMRHCPLWRISS